MALRLATSSPDAENATPAYSALLAHRAKIAEVKALDADWVSKENAELGHLQAYSAEQTALTQLEQAKVGAQADREVLGRSDVDLDDLIRQVSTTRSRVAELRDRSLLAEAKLVRIRQQRSALREQLTTFNDGLRPLQHAARSERLASAMESLLVAEAAYVKALTEGFGIAASVDELARAPGPPLPFAGRLDVLNLILPRPYHEAFSDVPSPQRADIAAAVNAKAEDVAQEL